MNKKINELDETICEVGKYLSETDDIISIYYDQSIDATISAAILIRTFYLLNIPCVAVRLDEYRDASVVIYICENLDPESLDHFPEDTIILTKSKLLHFDEYFFLSALELPTNNRHLTILSYLIAQNITQDTSQICSLALLSAYFENPTIHSEQILSNELYHDIIEEGKKSGVISLTKGFLFLGQSLFKTSQLLYYSLIPPLKGFTGNISLIGKLLYKVGISPESYVFEIDEDAMTRLNSQLVIELSSSVSLYDLPPHFMEEVIVLSREDTTSFLRCARDFYFSLLNASKENKLTSFLPVLIGERGDEFKRLRDLYKTSLTKPFDIFEAIKEDLTIETIDEVSIIQTKHQINQEYMANVLLLLKLNEAIPNTGITILTSTHSFISLVFGESNKDLKIDHVLSIITEKGLEFNIEKNNVLTINVTDLPEFVSSLREFIRLNFL